MSRLVAGVNGVLTFLVLAAAAAAALSLGGGQDARLDVLAHFAPVYGGLGLIGAVWAVVAGRGPIVAAAILAIAASCWLVLPEVNRDTGPVATPDAPGQIKVIQFNSRRDSTDIRRAADWIVAQHPDVVTLTEARHDLRDLLVRRTGWKLAGEQSDLMIFTHEVYMLMDRPSVPRGSLQFVNATYETSSGPMEVLTTHLCWPTNRGERRQEAVLKAVVAERRGDRMILTGDFNATPWSAELRRLDDGLGLIRRDRALATWPAQVFGQAWPLPFLPIDHVYAGRGWATVKVERGPWLGSDHYPLIVTLAPIP